MNLYFVKIQNRLSAKNKLQVLVLGLTYDYDKRIVFEDELDGFMSRMELAINDLNNQHPRCKPVSIQFEKDRLETGSVVGYVSELFTIVMYITKYRADINRKPLGQ